MKCIVRFANFKPVADTYNSNLTELKTLEWWISRSMRDLLFFLISRLTEKCIKFNQSESRIRSRKI